MGDQLGECLVLCHRLLHLSISFPTRVARGDEPLSGPRAGVESGQPKKFGAMFFKNCLPLLGGLDHFLGLVAFKARELYDRHNVVLLGYRKLPHETSGSCGGITAPLKHGGNAATNRSPERADGPTAWLQGKTTLARQAANGWKRQFNDPIPLPRGRLLVTLEDAGRYITKLPK